MQSAYLLTISSSMAIRNKQNAFSLIELVITVALIGIIMAVAMPSYQQYVIESQRSDAAIALTSSAAEQERLFTYSHAYSMDIDELGGSRSPGGHYTLSVTSPESSPPPANPQQFTLTATPATNSVQQQDNHCQTFTLNHLGVKASLDHLGNVSTDCW